MNDEDVTPVTRNKSRLPEEIKLIIDLATCAAMIYYVTHPECLDDLGDKVAKMKSRLAHSVSVWAARQDIRSLPEIDT